MFYKRSYVDTLVDAACSLLAIVLFTAFGLLIILTLVPDELIAVLRRL